ncbi:MAG: hypothetical protein DMD45_01945 [Gemmatimonadetes bacterium]|nr:MAG: hypothetical protein DMD45_01945 [Gemmatimonadota bacterium]
MVQCGAGPGRQSPGGRESRRAERDRGGHGADRGTGVSAGGARAGGGGGAPGGFQHRGRAGGPRGGAEGGGRERRDRRDAGPHTARHRGRPAARREEPAGPGAHRPDPRPGDRPRHTARLHGHARRDPGRGGRAGGARLGRGGGPRQPARLAALQVSVPILDGFRREARLAEQDAVVRESQVRERDLRQQIAADVDGALLDLHSAEAQQAVAAERLRLAGQELSQSRERFKAGVAGNIEVIDAQSNLIRARDTDIDARFAAATARVSLARAAGVARTLH